MINERGIWMSTEETDTHVHDEMLSNALVDMFAEVESVVDIGCGPGRYVKNFLDRGITCKGYDGSPLTPELSNGLCEVLDFSEPQDIGQFELALSLEVGEHLPPQYEQTFIDNVCRASKRWIVLSWATEGQGGNGHYNERNNDYIIAEVVKRGYVFSSPKSLQLRGVSEVPWFKTTLMVFLKL